MKSTVGNFLGGIPEALCDELVAAYRQIEQNYRERRWEPSELNGGKLCEVVYTILKGHVEGNFPNRVTKPRNMVDACRDFEHAGSAFPRSVRIQIPRMLLALYEVRNNRGVGHVGGDVNPNEMDATCVLQMSKWLLGELVRVFHSVTTDEAQELVAAISEREISLIWEVDGNLRVLDSSLTKSDQSLVILYSKVDGVREVDLVAYIEHSNASVFRRDILRALHKKRFIEYNANSRVAKISPLGAKHVESNILGTGA